MKSTTAKLTNVIDKTSKKGKAYKLLITEGFEEEEQLYLTTNYFCWNDLLIEGIEAPCEVVIVYDKKGDFRSIKAIRKSSEKELPIEIMVK